MPQKPSPLPRIAFLGGYLPRLCGIATFTHDLCEAVALAEPRSSCFTVAMNDRPEGYEYPSRVRLTIDQKDLNGYRRGADFLNFNNAAVLCVQHEFGIFGGPAGSHLLRLLEEVRMPVVTTLHTILQDPSADQRRVMTDLVRRSDRLVVMAQKGAEILVGTYGANPEKIDLIPHGIPDMPLVGSHVYKSSLGVGGRMVLLTFGLLGPGKGIEYAIEALPEIVKHHPQVVYLILGATHPHLVAREGENYRLSLERLAEDRGVKDHVIFYNRFVSLEDLKEFIGATDIYLTPYLNEAQITSGTLAYVFGAGKAVVSTPYWHAQELLANGRGTLVPFRDPGAIARAVLGYLGDPGRLAATGSQAHQMGRAMIWPAVAKKFLESFQRAGAERRAQPRSAFATWTLASRPFELPPLRLDHITRMTDSTGILQHAHFTVPNYHEGYCTDDNARAFILCTQLDELGMQTPADNLDRLASRYLAFLAAAYDPRAGRFRNFMSQSRTWLAESGSEDSHGRALWALGTGAARCKTEGHRKLCRHLFDLSLDVVVTFSSPRAWSFTLLGLHELFAQGGENSDLRTQTESLTEKLLALWQRSSAEDWPWFEPSVTYDNARLCQALLASGRLLNHPAAAAVGRDSLQWLSSLQRTRAGHFRPIGSNGFYPRGGTHADFDQQPVEAQAMVAACLEAFRSTQDPLWPKEAKRAFEWFLGRNDLGLPLYDPQTGGCGDGLHADRTNENQGAESTLAFHLALAEMNLAGHTLTTPGNS